MRHLPSLILSILFVLGISPSVVAADEEGEAPLVFTEPPENDPNYDLLGEFVGQIAAGEDQTRTLALQLRPVGGDDFEAMLFYDGLPGQAAPLAEPMRMIGRRSEDFLVLSGGPWAIFVDPDHCQIVSKDGQQMGRLDRVHRRSTTLGAPPPAEAVVLFDGTGTEHFVQAEMTEDGLLKQGARIKPMLQDFDMHVEFRLPYMPQADGQGRANSGVYLMSRYECQILDSFAQDVAFNGCGAIYRFKAPDVNMSLPPLVWQTYDIRFTAPRWAADGAKTRNARISIWLNGVLVQDNVEVPDKTGAGEPEQPLILPTLLQDHNDQVRFRNVWAVDRGLITGDGFPIAGPAEEIAEEIAEEVAGTEDSGNEESASD